MSWKTGLACLAIAAAAASSGAQQATSSTTQSTTTTTTTTTSGEVLRYEPGKTIVVRDANGRTMTYTIETGLAVPSDVQVGRKVTIYSSPVDGSIRVQKITTTQTTNPDGTTSKSTEVREEPGWNAGSSASQAQPSDAPAAPGMASAAPAQNEQTTQTTQTTTKTTRVSGTIRSYEPGQSITIVGPGSKVTTYTLTTDSQIPSDVAVGKQVTVETSVVSGKPVARTVTYRTTTKTTHTKSVSPK
jgi:hypothetical protein